MADTRNPYPDMSVFAGAREMVQGRYRLNQFLGEGNFGAVYRASHQAYGLELREVAIKISKRPMTDYEAHLAFGDALVMARVQQAAPPHLRERFVTVFDAGTCTGGPFAGHPYVVMELVNDGISLKSELHDNGAFPLRRAKDSFDQILEAMAWVHQHKYIHRDLKPANILVSRHVDRPDVLKVTDFGLAQETDSSLLGWVESGGDLAHLAPESFSHEICSHKTDVYMLGLVFYEMIAGKNPFADVGSHLHGEDPATILERKKCHELARLGERFPQLEVDDELKSRPAVAQVIRLSLARDMRARPFQHPGELKAAWDKAWTTGEPPPKVPIVSAWDKVSYLLVQAEAAGLPGRGEELLNEAMQLNRSNAVPPSKTVGRAYLRQVQVLLAHDKNHEAGQVATEGLGRRQCRSTVGAVAMWFRENGNESQATTLEGQAASHKDQD